MTRSAPRFPASCQRYILNSQASKKSNNFPNLLPKRLSQISRSGIMVSRSRAETSSQPALIVVLVNYCTASLTIACLRSLQPEFSSFPGSYVVGSDNASPDGSGAAIEQAIGAQPLVEMGTGSACREMEVSATATMQPSGSRSKASRRPAISGSSTRLQSSDRAQSDP